MIKLLRWSVLIVCMAFANAHAAVLLVDAGTGKLTGATGVDVGGAFYDVEFLDGTCAGVFSGCNDVADFPFPTQVGADAASQALLDQVFIDGTSGTFDSRPDFTRGCEDWLRVGGIGGLQCHALTPRLGVGSAPWYASDAANFALESWDQVSTQSAFCCNPDLGVEQDVTWVRWTLQPQAASEPGTIASLGVGLLALVLTLRRRTLPRVRPQ